MVDLASTMKQAEFGNLVGISQQAVSDLMSRGVIAEGGAASEWLLGYCRHLREQAAGRASSGEFDLASERARLAKEQADRIAMQNAVSRAELVPCGVLTDVLSSLAPKICGLLESIVPQLRRRSGYSAEDLGFVADTIAEARNAIADLKLPDIMGECEEDVPLDPERDNEDD